MKQRGFSLIEVMIASLISVIILGVLFQGLAIAERQLLCLSGHVRLGCRAVVLTDPETRCQYIVTAGTITPRRDANNYQIGCKSTD